MIGVPSPGVGYSADLINPRFTFVPINWRQGENFFKAQGTLIWQFLSANDLI